MENTIQPTPKGILEFPLPECNTEFKMAVHAGDMYCALFEINNMARRVYNGKVERTMEAFASEVLGTATEALQKIDD